MSEIQKIDDEVKKLASEFVHFVKTAELKFFGGILHQKLVHPVTNESAWVAVEEHKPEAPAAAPPAETPAVSTT
jgi:hypothetical protein